MDSEKAANFWKGKVRKEMPSSQLWPIVEKFLSEKNVCALATGFGDHVRCTPLEYSFHDGSFWIFTEGGEKFVGLAKNDNVSLAVFDQNPGFDSLKSVQVTGKAECIEPMTERYLAHAAYKKIPTQALQQMAEKGHPLYLLCVTPIKMDVLFSEFKKQGFDSRQILHF